MTLSELVAYFRKGGSLEDFCKTQALDIGAEVIEIYARVPVTLESQLRFFSLSEAGGRTTVLSNGEDWDIYGEEIK